jgi:hypothetical protein
MIGWSNTSNTARRSALAPSSTTRIGRVTSKPRSRRPASRSRTHRGVLGRALGQGERDLGAVDGDAERDHAGVVGDADPVDQERHQV